MLVALDSKKTALLPEEGSLRAIAHEAEGGALYYQLSLRFLAYQPAVSRLFDILADECRERVRSLAHTAERMQLVERATLKANAQVLAATPACSHFFVTDEAMASRLIREAQQRAEQSLACYRFWFGLNAVTAWQPLLKEIVEQKRAECRLIAESVPGNLPTLSPILSERCIA
ncbi:hypothetical protein [Modicisalibacter tunisiensis]|uniref:DUF892 family protein n=1 Tax=Modicisalibacter tunisiensis TaxID=390637 RepID=A0ABS7X1T8_9GAMM|nr:hypothetical protein [Modicisalibacter tunisiensis]MBZ9568858.1 hypothetical protein [Modicisalibacter tunisiensis]